MCAYSLEYKIIELMCSLILNGKKKKYFRNEQTVSAAADIVWYCLPLQTPFQFQ